MTGPTRGLVVMLLGALLAGGVLAKAGGSEIWMNDLPTALEVAQRDGKDVLVDFTGSDWCGWCIRLDKEVFSHDAFLEYAQDRYVLVALDFPREDGEVWKAMSVEQRDRNQEELMRYQVQGFPTILLMTPDGVRYANTGYQEGGPKAYNEHLEGLRINQGERVRQDVQLLRAEAAVTEDRLAAAYALFPNAREDMRQEILALVRSEDPDDPRGLLTEEAVRLIFVEHLERDTPDLVGAARELDALRVATPRVDDVAHFQFARAWVALSLEDVDTARRCTERLAQLDGAQPGMVDWLQERIAALEQIDG